VLFFQAQPFFKREGIGLVHFKSNIGFANPGGALGDVEGSVFGGHLLDANRNLHVAASVAMRQQNKGRRKIQR
jgi:hypothetical protein